MSISFGPKTKLFFNNGDNKTYQENYEAIFKAKDPQEKGADRPPDRIVHGRKQYFYGRKAGSDSATTGAIAFSCIPPGDAAAQADAGAVLGNTDGSDTDDGSKVGSGS